MAWSKNVHFLIKTHAAWTLANPVVPVGALIGVDMSSGSYRLKVGTGNNYTDTKFINEVDLDEKLSLGDDPELVVFDDGSRGQIDTITIQGIIDAGYHLVTDAEWEYLKLKSIAPPSFIASPGFSTSTIKEIGDPITGAYTFDFTKTNNDSLKTTTGGNIAVNQGTWSGLGDFDLKGLSQKTITATSFTLSSAGKLIFTLFGRDVYDQQVALQTFELEFQYPVFGGTKSNTTLSSEADLSNLVKRVGKTADEMEFYLDPGGSSHYFHLLVPTEIATNIDIRDMSSPGPASGNMTLQGTVVLTVGSISKTYNHYVSEFQSAAEVDFIIKDLS